MKVLQLTALSILVLLSSACCKNRRGCCGPRADYSCAQPCEYAPDNVVAAPAEGCAVGTTEVMSAGPVIVEEDIEDAETEE